MSKVDVTILVLVFFWVALATFALLIAAESVLADNHDSQGIAQITFDMLDDDQEYTFTDHSGFERNIQTGTSLTLPIETDNCYWNRWIWFYSDTFERPATVKIVVEQPCYVPPKRYVPPEPTPTPVMMAPGD